MKLLLDESIDVNFRHHLTGHDVYTVTYMGWKGIKNGALLARAADEDFEAMITTDSAMAQQQNLSTLLLSIVVLRPQSNRLKDLEALVPELLKELNHLSPRSVVYVAP